MPGDADAEEGYVKMPHLHLAPGSELLCIRSSDIAFTMGAKGPLIEKAHNYEGDIPKY